MWIKTFFHEWKNEFLLHWEKILFSLCLLAGVVVLNVICSTYAQTVGSTVARDLILDHFPPINLTWMFVYLWLAVIAFLFIYPSIFKVNKIHEVVFHFSLLLMIRALFLIFTHLKTPDGAIPIHFPWPFDKMAFENDLFFSGHTALPLVGFFVFGHSRIKYIFLALSLLMGFTVLAMHQHYSIDVFAAYFIAYGSYMLGDRIISRKIK